MKPRSIAKLRSLLAVARVFVVWVCLTILVTHFDFHPRFGAPTAAPK
jgi:hypothetical protein